MKTKRTLVVMFMLVLALLVGVFPGGAAFAEGGGDPLALRFVCDETVASVTVYDPAGLPLPVGADGIHHLTPGTYFYSATAEGYESTGLQAFTIPADAAGDQELRISLTPVPGSVPPGASTPGQTLPDASVPGQTPVNAPDPNAPEENPEDDGKLRIRPVDGSLTLTIERETKTESAVPPEVQNLLEGKQKPLLTPDGMPVEKKLWLKTPDAEELYLDRLAVEKEIGYYTTDWTVLNLTDEEGDRKNLVPASGWYDVTVSGPATETYRAYEPVFALVTLHWDEEGDIVDRDVQILETTHTPTKSSWSFSTDTLSTLVIAVPTDRPYIDETAKKPALTERTVVSEDGKVEVSGLLPEDAQLVVVEIPLSFAAELYSIRTGEAKAEEEILFAYDISILSDGEKFQPDDFGESVRVSVGGLNTGEEPSDVLHVKADAVNGAGVLDLSAVGAAGSAESELLPVSAEDGVVAFETEGFSVFIGATKGAPLRGVAASGTCGDNLTWSLDENGTLTISGTGAMDDGQEWYDQSGDIKSVVIENGVTSIGGYAFQGCGNLGSVTFAPGSQLASIGGYAFQGCGNLGSIEIPSGVTTIGELAFYNCVNLESVTFTAGSNLTSIGNRAFELCVTLRSIEIPESVTSIGASAFKSCEGLLSIEIPASVRSIGDEAFLNCTYLESVTFTAGSNLTSIGDYAFDGCESDIWYHGTESQWSNIPKGTNWAGSNLTVHCELSITVEPSGSGTVSASFGQDVPTPAAGKYWSNTDVTLTATANSNYAFVNWTENVNGSVTTVSTDASYSFTATTDRDLVANFAIGGTCGDHLTWTLDGNGTLTISGTGAMYDSVLWNGQKENIKKVVINNGVTTIGDLAFFQCVNLGSVEIPSSVTTIRSKAFENCTNLTSVTFADGSQLERIGDYAFSGSGLGSIQIPSSVTSIGASAFLSCSNLESVTFAEGSALTSMGVSAFQLCKKLTSVTIPLGVTSIENYAFDTCTGLTDVTIPSSVTSIGNYAFNACSRLGSIKIPAGVKSIGVDAFRDCESLESVTIPSSVTSIGNYAFNACKKLTNVTIERSDTATVLAIGSNAFLCGTDSATLSWTGILPEDRCVVFTVSPDTAGYSISGTTLSWNANPNSTAEATLRATFVQLPSAKLEVTKEFNDWSKADSFTFNLAAVTENAPMPANTTATATKGAPTAVFGVVTYDTAGTYEYAITEVNDDIPGVTYDKALHSVVVTVSKDGNNKLSADVKYDGANSLIITNTYATTTATLQVTKEFNDWGKADSFTFELAPVDNAPMPANSTTVPVTTTATKDLPIASFGEITYDKAGTYKYTITERNGGADGVTYDKAAHNVVVTVTKAEDATNALSATVAYDGQDSLTVTNTFTPATATLEVTKSLNSWRAGDSFTFTLAPVNGAPMPPSTTATATEQNKKATFDEITYETAGSYEYTITEVNGGVAGVTYDTTPHNVVVTVSKDGNNKLSADVKYDRADSLEVTNTRQFYGVVIDTSMTGGTVIVTPASAAAGDTVTLTVTPDKGSELTSLTVTATGKAVNVDPDQNDPNLYSFVMPATGVAVTATFKEILYTVVEGADSSWLKGSNGDLSIKVKRDPKDETCFQHFRNGGSVAIDGAVLSEDTSALIQKDYKAEEGSTVITLHAKMLNRLSAGKHTVTITFDDGSASTGLTILVPPGGYSPTTGDSSRIGVWAAVMVLAGLGFVGADYARRKFRRPRYVGKH
ncbi:MAG: leucine-rich repeat protein [Oscillospiraceae bacterium]|nr:leucine-rich repeat protein [Oscillospiraceae bacterium]